jgi:tRNA(fMet)-specific endonuclease VapC
MKILLDTNMCIYIIKNNPPEVREHFSHYSLGDIGIPAIAVAELYYGIEKSSAKEKNLQALTAFLLPLVILPFDMACAMAYGKIRAELELRGTPIGGMDMLIAAHAIAHQYTLITHNLKEFQRVPKLECATWVSQ